MKRWREWCRQLLPVVACVLASVAADAQICYDRHVLAEKRRQVERGEHKAAYAHLLKYADWLLTLKPLSVMDKRHVAVSGDKHDYYSLNYYAWPDSTKPGGRPYTTADCRPNPAYKEYDYGNLCTMTSMVQHLALAWYFTRDERYAAKAVEQIKAWFLDPATAMNPNMDYCQVVPGVDGDQGRSVLDGTCIASVVNSASLLQRSRSFGHKDQRRLRAWVEEFHRRMADSRGGRWCDGLENNIAVAFDYQRLVYWLYCGHKRQARRYMATFPQRRLFKQLAADGSQPLELRRPNAFNYSWYNIQWLTDVYIISAINGIGGADRVAPNGASFFKAVDFLTPFVGRERDAWPYGETMDWETVQRNARRELYRIGRVLNKKYTGLGVVPDADVYNLVY